MARRKAWLGILAVLALLPCAAELVYRGRFRAKLASLHHAARADHDRGSHAWVRFGEPVEALSASLAVDVLAWLQRRLGRPSPLGGEDRRFSHGYAGVLFAADAKTTHVFFWSPRRLDFYHAANWGLESCASRTCPWSRDPQTLGFGPSLTSE